MKIVIISDTHNLAHMLEIPDGDVLVHAGDFTMRGTEEEFRDFAYWLSTLPHKDIVICAGNHDWLAESDPLLAKNIIEGSRENVHFLLHEAKNIQNIKFFASPFTPTFFNWAFNLDRGEPIKQKWDLIPNDVDVLITHGPPFGILDVVGPDFRNKVAKHVGCEELRKKIDTMDNLKVHISGHLHNSYGYIKEKNKTFISAASLNDRYNVANRPILFNI